MACLSSLLSSFSPFCFFVFITITEDWVAAIMFSIAISVGLTPEMLPMIISVNLARGSAKLAEEQVIVKKGEAIVNLGVCTMNEWMNAKPGRRSEGKENDDCVCKFGSRLSQTRRRTSHCQEEHRLCCCFDLWRCLCTCFTLFL